MFSVLQIILIMLIWIIYQILSNMFIFCPYGTAVLIGWITGAVLGDPTTGLLVGGTMELMSIGMNPLGGSSVPDYYTGCIVGVAFAIGTHQGMDVGIAVNITVGTLGVQIDVFNKMLGTYFAHKEIEANEKMDFKGVETWIVRRFAACIALTALPVFLVLILGNGVMQTIVNNMPVWLTHGLSLAGGVLPAVGFAILLRSLPIKSNFQYIIFGYVLAAYLQQPVLAVALLALVIAIVYYQNQIKSPAAVTAGSSNGGVQDDE